VSATKVVPRIKENYQKQVVPRLLLGLGVLLLVLVLGHV